MATGNIQTRSLVHLVKGAKGIKVIGRVFSNTFSGLINWRIETTSSKVRQEKEMVRRYLK